MPRTTSFVLGDHFESFVGEQLMQGRYSNASEVVRAGLRLLEEKEAEFARLRAALIAGEESGAAKPLSIDALKRKGRMTSA